jgi:hypothetical protein
MVSATGLLRSWAKTRPQPKAIAKVADSRVMGRGIPVSSWLVNTLTTQEVPREILHNIG